MLGKNNCFLPVFGGKCEKWQKIRPKKVNTSKLGSYIKNAKHQFEGKYIKRVLMILDTSNS